MIGSQWIKTIGKDQTKDGRYEIRGIFYYDMTENNTVMVRIEKGLYPRMKWLLMIMTIK